MTLSVFISDYLCMPLSVCAQNLAAQLFSFGQSCLCHYRTRYEVILVLTLPCRCIQTEYVVCFALHAL